MWKYWGSCAECWFYIRDLRLTVRALMSAYSSKYYQIINHRRQHSEIIILMRKSPIPHHLPFPSTPKTNGLLFKLLSRSGRSKAPNRITHPKSSTGLASIIPIKHVRFLGTECISMYLVILDYLFLSPIPVKHISSLWCHVWWTPPVCCLKFMLRLYFN